MPFERAARVTSPVAHTSTTARNVATPAAFVVLGLIVGASAVATGGVTLGVAAGAMGWAGVTQSAGDLLDNYVMPTDASEKIDKGVDHVFLEQAKHKAANVSDKTLTDEHQKKPKTGSDSVSIEGMPACRKGDFTECGGTIVDGAEHIFYGGTPTSAADKPKDEDQPMWREVMDKVLEVGGLIQPKPKKVWEAIDWGMNAADLVGAVPEGPVKDAVWGAKDVYGLF